MSYVEFNPPRRVEEYPNRVSTEVLEEVAKARLTHTPPKYLVKGEFIRPDDTHDLDIAINREWVTAVSDYELKDGSLRWVCPGCGRLSGAHNKGCDYR
jgi:hypothetical protein